MNLKQLAQSLQLSQTTVSRALNGFPEVGEKTRRRVVSAARAAGYRPNPAARRLATGKTGVLGFVMNTSYSRGDPHFMEFLSGMGEHAFKRGFDIQLSPTDDVTELETYERLAAAGLVDALVLSSPTLPDPRINLLEGLNIPFLVHGRAPSKHTPQLDIDNKGAFCAATRLLVQLGHHRIALINGEPDMVFAQDRRSGYLQGLEEAEIPKNESLIVGGEMTEAFGYRQTERLLAAHKPPTAILCSSMFIALGVIRAAKTHNLTIGSDLSVIAHDDDFAYLRPENFIAPLTTTYSPIYDAGRRVAERLIAQLAGGPPDVDNEVWPVDLIVRGSTGPAPNS